MVARVLTMAFLFLLLLVTLRAALPLSLLLLLVLVFLLAFLLHTLVLPLHRPFLATSTRGQPLPLFTFIHRVRFHRLRAHVAPGIPRLSPWRRVTHQRIVANALQNVLSCSGLRTGRTVRANTPQSRPSVLLGGGCRLVIFRDAGCRHFVLSHFLWIGRTKKKSLLGPRVCC